MIILMIIGYILLVLVAILVAILAVIIVIPYHYQADGKVLWNNFQDSQFVFSVSWLFDGVVLFITKQPGQRSDTLLEFCGLTKKIQERKKSTHEPRQKSKDRRQNPHHKNIRHYMRFDVIQTLLTSLKKILKHCLPENLIVQGKIGFRDPMDTGLLFALLSQRYILHPDFYIAIEPVFDKEIVDITFEIGGKIRLLYLIRRMIELLISKPIRDIFLRNLKSKFKGGSHYAGEF